MSDRDLTHQAQFVALKEQAYRLGVEAADTVKCSTEFTKLSDLSNLMSALTGPMPAQPLTPSELDILLEEFRTGRCLTEARAMRERLVKQPIEDPESVRMQ